MKILWCWRCKMEVPMLDEEEFKIAKTLYSQAFKWANNSNSNELVTDTTKVRLVDRHIPLLEYYNELTGWNETVPNAIMHHEIALYGEPCVKCGKPLRTPMATFCAACGNKK